jgi:hypothetical protein
MDNKEKSPLAALLKKPVQASTDVSVKAQPNQKPESQKTPIEKDVTTIKKDVAEVKKNTKVLADIAKKSDKDAKRAKPVAAVIPAQGQTLTGDLNADILKVLSNIDKKLSADSSERKKGEGEKGAGPGPLASLVDTLGDIFGGGRGRPGAPPRAPTPAPQAPAPQAPAPQPPRAPTPAPQAPAPQAPRPTPGPVGQALSKVGEVALQAGRAALPYAAPAAIAAAPFVATRAQIEEIKADPNAPELEFNPLAQSIRNNTTVGVEGRQNRNRAVRQVFSNTIQAAIDSKMTDEELMDEYGRTREQLKEWVAKSKPGEKYTEPQVTGAAPAAPTLPPVEMPASVKNVESSATGVTPQDREEAKKRGIRGEAGAQTVANQRIERRQVQVQGAFDEVNNVPLAEPAPTSAPQQDVIPDKEEETGPVSGMERAIMLAEGLDPDNEFDRKLYRRRRDISRGQRPQAPGKDVGTQPTPSPAPSNLSQQSVLPAAQVQSQPRPTEPTSTSAQVTSTFDAAALAEKDPETHAKYVARVRQLEREKLSENEKQGKISSGDTERAKARAQEQAIREFSEPAATVGAATRSGTMTSSRGGDIAKVSTENNDLRDQASAGGAAPPMIVNNNNSTATQTNVPVPAQPRVDSSFSRYGQSRASYW